MKKRLFLFSLILFFVFSSVFADFLEGEKPVWALSSDTAYTLRSGEWSLGWVGLGVINYGIFDNLQVGTVFWPWFLQIMNVVGKFNFIQETENFPSIAVASKFFNITKSGLQYYNISGIATKNISGNLYTTLCYTYNKINLPENIDDQLKEVAKKITGLEDPTSMSNIALSLIYQSSKVAKLILEGSVNIYDKTYYYLCGGVEWALGDAFRLKLGIFTFFGNENAYLPFLDLYLRFK